MNQTDESIARGKNLPHRLRLPALCRFAVCPDRPARPGRPAQAPRHRRLRAHPRARPRQLHVRPRRRQISLRPHPRPQRRIPHPRRQTLAPRHGRDALLPRPRSRVGNRNPQDEVRRRPDRLRLHHLDPPRRGRRPVGLVRTKRPPPLRRALRQAWHVRRPPHRPLVARRSPQRRLSRLAARQDQPDPLQRPHLPPLRRPLLPADRRPAQGPHVVRRRPGRRHPA